MPGIGKLLSERLHAAGLSTLRELAAADPRRIEAVTQRHYPFGSAHAVAFTLMHVACLVLLLHISLLTCKPT